VNFLLDTNAVVALLRNKPVMVRDRFRAAQASGDYIAVSSVVLYELWYDVQKSAYVTENTERLTACSSRARPSSAALPW
jgi:tRNA(fMet)-specific endonuclease VapC